MGRVASMLTVFALATSLTGCNDTTKQKTMAEAAAKRFQALYNSGSCQQLYDEASHYFQTHETRVRWLRDCDQLRKRFGRWAERSEEHTSELQSHVNLVCRLLLEKK